MKSKFALLSGLIAFILFNFACQSAGPLAAVFATSTPTFTITPTATSTSTPSPTPLPTGIQFEEQSDQSIRVVDYDSGYIFLLSQDWIVLPGDADALKEAVEKLSVTNPEITEMMEYISMLDNQALRFMAFNKNKEYREGTLLTNLIALTIEDRLAGSLPMDLLVEINVEQLKKNVSISNVLSYSNDINQNGVEYGYIQVETTVIHAGQPEKAHQNIVLIKNDSSMTLFNLTLPFSKKESGRLLVQDFIASIELVDGK